MTDRHQLRLRAVEAIAALRDVLSHDSATVRAAHVSRLTAETLEHWWLPLLDEPGDDG